MVEKLTSLQIRSLAQGGKAGAYAVGGAAGLYLRIAPAGAVSWTLRTTINGKRVERGLGGYPAVALGEARQKAAEMRDRARAGIDTKVERAVRHAAAVVAAREARNVRTFAQAAEACVAANEARWRNAKHAQQWRNTLTQYAYPILGEMPCGEIGHAQIVAVLDPLWHVKQETARRLRGRIETVLDYAEAHGWRPDGLRNPAAPNAKLKAALPPMPKRQGVAGRRGHYAAMRWSEVSSFMGLLGKREGISAQALAFTILTAGRSGEVRGMVWGEVEGNLWTVPASRMKSGRVHRVPLSLQARAIVDALRPEAPDEDAFVFPSPRKGGVLSDMALTKLLRDMGSGVTAHGFRSSFRDWCADNGRDRALAEASLAHALGSAVEAAYQRSDMLSRRAELMQAWAKFVLP